MQPLPRRDRRSGSAGMDISAVSDIQMYAYYFFFSYVPKSSIQATESRRILQERCGKSPYLVWKHRKSLEHRSSIPTGNCPDFFRWIPVNFLCFPVGIDLKSSERIRKFPVRNTASTKSPELLGIARFQAGLFDLGRCVATSLLCGSQRKIDYTCFDLSELYSSQKKSKLNTSNLINKKHIIFE
jgi:hypothetical protein